MEDDDEGLNEAQEGSKEDCVDEEGVDELKNESKGRTRKWGRT